MSVNEIICGKTPLQHALQCSSNGKKPVVDYLLTRGADVNAKDVNGNTGNKIFVFSTELILTLQYFSTRAQMDTTTLQS